MIRYNLHNLLEIIAILCILGFLSSIILFH